MSQAFNVVHYFDKVLNCQDRFLVMYGGAGSAKSYSVQQKILLRIISEIPHNYLCIRKVGNTLKNSIFNLFWQIINKHNLSEYFKRNLTELSITYIPNGNRIFCMGLDDVEKLKSIAGITGIWIEEATEIDEADFDQIDIRLRGETAHYKQIILTFNPVEETHWLKKRFFDNTEWLNNLTYTTLHTTYRDNYYIDSAYKDNLNAKALVDPNFHRVYTLGLWGKRDVKRPYMFNFSSTKHVIKGLVKDNAHALILSFDFNVDPFVCIIGQVLPSIKPGVRRIRLYDEIVLRNADVYRMCEVIRTKLSDVELSRVLVTGDATSRKKQIGVRDNIDAWTQIQQFLNISNNRMKVPSANPSVKTNQVHCNYVLFHDDVAFDSTMTTTINDMMYVETDREGNIIKDRSNDNKYSDALDCFRYLLNSFVDRKV